MKTCHPYRNVICSIHPRQEPNGKLEIPLNNGKFTIVFYYNHPFYGIDTFKGWIPLPENGEPHYLIQQKEPPFERAVGTYEQIVKIVNETECGARLERGK